MVAYIPKKESWSVIEWKCTYFWRILAGVHPCLHMSSMATGGFSENAESAESAEISGIFAIFGEILMGTMSLSRVDF